MPKNALAILDLATGEVATIERLKALRVPEEDSGWFAYQIDVEAKPAETKPVETKPAETNPEAADPKKPQKRKDHAVGSEWILREFATERHGFSLSYA